jgi:ATP-binding cassette subfamily B protein
MRKDGLRRLYPYLKRYKKILLLGFLFVTISNICSTYVPRVVGQTVDYLKEENYNMEDTFARIGLILLLTLGSGLFMYLTRRTIIYSSRYIEYDLRRDLLLSMQSQDIDYFNRNSVDL